MSQKNYSNFPFDKQTEPILYNGKMVWTEEIFPCKIPPLPGRIPNRHTKRSE